MRARFGTTLAVATGLTLGLARPALAVEPATLGGEPIRLDITEASSVSINADNRDDRPNDVSTRANDEWTLWYNRLNVQGSWKEWQVGVRLDSAKYFQACPSGWGCQGPEPTAIALELVDDRARPLGPGAVPDPVYFRQKVDEAGIELSNRYIDWIYPAKYYVGYTTRDVELTVGDFYAQLGRGLVLSLRKLDELSSDTTIRGARATGRIRAGKWRLRLTGLGGVANPLRIDDASGRYLGVDDSVTGGVTTLTEAGMPRAIETDFAPSTFSDGSERDCASHATCTYAPDRIVGGQIEVGTDAFKLGTQVSGVLRTDGAPNDRLPERRARFIPLSDDVVRSADTVLTGSQSVNIPDLFDHGSAYAEVALQQLSYDVRGGDTRDPDLNGHAVYGSVTFIELPVTVLLEAKHYRRFYPLSANVKLSRAREFNTVQYSAPPTTEAFWVDTEFEGFNTCVTGGRAKGDVEVGEHESVFAWVGRYHTWAESVQNEECEIRDDYENRVWDVATGFEITSQQRKSRHSVTLGARMDTSERALVETGPCTDPLTGDVIPSCTRGETNVFYQEGYVRSDLIRWISGPYSLQLQGWHRRRRQTLGGADDPWFEGQHLTGFEWAPHVSLTMGVEYDTNPQTPDTYFNGQLAYRFTSDTSASLFVGQRRGALRCVAGVCRIFPPFEGARLDVTARF